MDNEKDGKQTYEGTATVPLAYHEVCMSRNHKTIFRIALCWAISIIAAIGIFTFLWLQYDYEASVDASGVYVVTDANGNVIASDLTPDDIIRIMSEISDGENQSKENP